MKTHSILSATVKTPVVVLLAISLFCGSAVANETTNEHKHNVEEVLVVDQQVKRTFIIDNQLSVLPDTAQLLKQFPGGGVNSNGALTGIPQYRGFYGARLATVIDGTQIASAGPNWMDPPLSYAAPYQLESLQAFRGATPVSLAQESIGGLIIAETWRGDFGVDEQFTSQGRLSVAGQSVNDSSSFNVMSSLANHRHRFNLAAMTESGDDAEFPDGVITPTEYERKRATLGYAYQYGNHQVELELTRNETGESGTPSLPMDIDYFDGDLFRLAYDYQASDWRVEATLYGSDLDHGMTNFHLRQAPMNPAMFRQNIATSENRGFNLKTALTDNNGEWGFGLDYFQATHNSDIDNPNNPMFFVTNFNDTEREVIGAYIERQQKLADDLRIELGARVNRVKLNADTVDATPARMMPPATMLRDNFNAADRSSSESNLDLVAKLWFEASDALTYSVALSQKHRAPSYLEKFLWLPLQATGGLADGFTYTGNLDLKAEKSSELEFGLEVHNNHWRLSPRIYYRDVSDYIQGTPSNVAPARMFVTMLNRNTGANNPAPLQFNNVDAKLYGMDMDWSYEINGNWGLSGLLSMVRAERKDIDDYLYRITPDNASFGVDYRKNQWHLNVELVVFADQDRVSQTNGELETDGYELINLSALYSFSDQTRIAVGIRNLLDESYEHHLGGYNRARNADIALGERIPGYARSVSLQLNHAW